MKLKNFLKLILAFFISGFVVWLFLFASFANAGEVIGDGTNGFYVHSMSSNVGFFRMELIDSASFHGQKSQKFWIHSLDSGSVKIRKTYTQPINRSAYTECLTFKRLYDLLPEVNNVYIKTLFYISSDGLNFFYIGTSYEFGRGVIGFYWLQCIMGFANNAPTNIIATQIELQVYFLGSPSTDSIRAECGLDYWTFSAWSYPQIIIDDFEGIPSGVIQNQNTTSEKFSLSQNYPNPFNPLTVINFKLPVKSQVILKVYDVLGKEVTVLVNEKLNAGSYEIDFNAKNLTSGTYFYRITAGEFVETKKMILIK